MLAAAIEQARPGARLLVVGFGQGVDLLVLELGHAARPAEPRGVAAALAEGLATDSYLRMLPFYAGIALARGVRAHRRRHTALPQRPRHSTRPPGSSTACCPACGTVTPP